MNADSIIIMLSFTSLLGALWVLACSWSATTTHAEVVEMSEFDRTMNAKVMPTGVVPDTILNPYVTSSKLVTLKKTVSVRIPEIEGQTNVPAEVQVSVGRYDSVSDLVNVVSETIGVPTQQDWTIVSSRSGKMLTQEDLGWLEEGESVILQFTKGNAVPSNARKIQVFKNGEITGGVDYALSKFDTCKTIIAATGTAVGIDAVHMADNPGLYDEAGLVILDEDLGWLPDGAKLWIVPQHR